MRVLVTGNAGYIGPVLGQHLRSTLTGVELIGFDTGYFAHSLTGAEFLPELMYHQQIVGDLRDLDAKTLEGVDIVIHLAAISNDPMGDRFEQQTEAINLTASLELARQAQAAGVGRFVFASSCSIYGAAGEGARSESDEVRPLTAYARSKVAMEEGLRALASPGFVVTALRFATACGASDRLRLDLVLNDFVLGALLEKKVTVLSDGTPWRPLVDVKDMARAIEWACLRETKQGGAFVAVNVGRENYQVRDLAEAVASSLNGVTVSINKDAAPDKRSYSVDFGLFQKLAPDHQPQVTLTDSINEIAARIDSIGIRRIEELRRRFVRLQVLRDHMESGRLDTDLRWRLSEGREG